MTEINKHTSLDQLQLTEAPFDYNSVWRVPWGLDYRALYGLSASKYYTRVEMTEINKHTSLDKLHRAKEPHQLQPHLASPMGSVLYSL
jgi:hypothetical protein